MSAPSWPPVPLQASDAYALHSDRAGIRRWHVGLVLLHAVLGLAIAAFLVWIMQLGGQVTLIMASPMLLLLANQFFQVAWHAFLWGARAAIVVPLVVRPDGFTMHAVQGMIRAPWEAVASVGIRRRLFGPVLVIKLRTDALHLVSLDDDPARAQQKLRRGLIFVGQKGVREDLTELLAVVAAMTSGRVAII